jgi:hypothetical protein
VSPMTDSAVDSDRILRNCRRGVDLLGGLPDTNDPFTSPSTDDLTATWPSMSSEIRQDNVQSILGTYTASSLEIDYNSDSSISGDRIGITSAQAAHQASILSSFSPASVSPEAHIGGQASLRMLVQILKHELVGRVDGAFLRRNFEERTWEVWVVAQRHTDEIYDLIVRLEDLVMEKTGRTDVFFQVRARKDRPASAVVPLDATLLPLV